jgi:SHS2 domain-containing protein
MALPVANTAKYELMLPSQQKTIKFRPFLVKEEKVLLMAMESGESKEMLSAIKEIVKSCTFGEMQAEDYPMFDIEYVFLQIRSKSVGEKTKLKVLCPDDGKTYAETEIDLSKIEVFVDDDHSPNILIDEDRKLGVVMRYPALKDVDSDTLQGDINIQKTYKMITNCIEQIYEGEKVYLRADTSDKELQEFVDNLSADQMKKLSTFYNTMPRLEHKVKVKNPKTEVESEVTLKGLASFFG